MLCHPWKFVSNVTLKNDQKQTSLFACKHMSNNILTYSQGGTRRNINSMIFLQTCLRALAAYQEDNDKCSHLSDPCTSLRSDKAATGNRLRSRSTFVLQDRGKQNELALMPQKTDFKAAAKLRHFTVTASTY